MLPSTKNMHSIQKMCFATFCDTGVNPIMEKLPIFLQLIEAICDVRILVPEVREPNHVDHVIGHLGIDSIIFLNFKSLSNTRGCTAWFVSDMVETPEYKFKQGSMSSGFPTRLNTKLSSH